MSTVRAARGAGQGEGLSAAMGAARTGATALSQRMPMPDIARFLGIVLVYYGHIIERVMYLHDPTATMHYKLIYSFHMPFFFLLAGYVADAGKGHLPLRLFLRRQAASRLVPYLFFSLLLVLMSLALPGHFVLADVTSAQGYMKGVLTTLFGFPVFNIPLWFFVSLFAVELLHYGVGRFLNTDFRLLAAAMLFYTGGYYLTLKVQFFPGPNLWFAYEAPVVYAFYLAGVFLRRKGFLLRRPSVSALLGGMAACAFIVALTFTLNKGPFRFFDAVVIVLGGHGHIFWFPFTALAGSVMLLLAASLCGNNGSLRYLGENTLIFFCLNGVFYHFLNGPFAAWFMESLPVNPFTVTAAGSGFTLLSLACCVPAVVFLRRYLPQLVGRPAQDGPLLRPFIGRNRGLAQKAPEGR